MSWDIDRRDGRTAYPTKKIETVFGIAKHISDSAFSVDGIVIDRGLQYRYINLPEGECFYMYCEFAGMNQLIDFLESE